MSRVLMIALMRAAALVFAASFFATLTGCGKSPAQGGAPLGTAIASAKPGSAPQGGGSDVGNGGSVVTLPDGRVVIADPYFNRPDQGEVHHYSDFSPAIREEIELVGRLLVRLGAAVGENVDIQFPPQMGRSERNAAIDQVRLGRKLSRAAQARFVVESISDPVVEYHFVDRIPSTCHGGEDVGPTAAGGTVVLGGCNEGDAVWFQKDVFRSMSVRNGDANDPREQVKWIIHERLHSINLYGHPHYYIADVTNGIDVLLDLYKAESKGERPKLTPDQQANLALLVERIAQFRGLTPDGSRDDRFVSDWQISPNGGGLVHKSTTVDATAYVGAGSMLGSGGSLGAGSAFLSSLCFAAGCSLGENAIMRDAVVAPRVSQRSTSPSEETSRAFPVTLAKDAQVTGSSLYFDLPSSASPVGGARFDEGAKLETSIFSGLTTLHIGARSRVVARLEVEIRDEASTAVDIGSDARVDGLQASFRSHSASAARQIVIPTGAVLLMSGPPCRAPQVPWLDGTLSLDTPEKLQMTCADISH